MDYDLTTGIPVEHLDDFVNILKKKFNLDDKVCMELKTMAHAKSNDKLLFKVKYENEFEFKYGYIDMTMDSDNTIRCFYALHNLNFKLADRRIETRSKKYFWFIPYGETVDVTHESVSLDISLIRDTYMRHRALEALRNEGIIGEITYEE